MQVMHGTRGIAGVIDASNAIGLDLNRLFVGFLKREFGADAFTVERIAKQLPCAG